MHARAYAKAYDRMTWVGLGGVGALGWGVGWVGGWMSGCRVSLCLGRRQGVGVSGGSGPSC